MFPVARERALSTKEPSVTTPKVFDDATNYDREIRMLVPGYQALHAMIPAVAAQWLHHGARVLCVGCGTGEEAVALLRSAEGITLDAIDPSSAMCAATTRAFRRDGMAERATVASVALHDHGHLGAYDLVLAVLVGHFIADDGARATFVDDLQRALKPEGVVLLVEFENSGPSREHLTDAHLRWSLKAGVHEARLGGLRERLTTGFNLLRRDRFEELAEHAGLRVRCEFFRALGVVGLILERSATRA